MISAELQTPQLLEAGAQQPNDVTDLLSLARAGDTAAFGELCRQHEARLLRHARLLSSDDASAEDLAQETLIAAWHALPRFNNTCQFFTWLCAILLNLHRSRERKNRFWRIIAQARFGNTATENELEHLPDTCPTAAAWLEAEEHVAEVRMLLSRLPRKQREVLYLRFFAAESLNGIAAALNCSVGTVKSRLFNGLEKLRKMAPKELQR
jgi:RNA polymerase sigma-70 factor, ECF subfamily